MKYTVLICDDNVAVHKSLTSYLHSEGIEVISAYTGEEALELLKQRKVDILVLDIMMPGSNGLDVCRNVRKTDSNIYIIILSAKGDELDRVVGLEVGADDYVVKPFSPREMTVRIRRVLGRICSKSEEQILTFSDLKVYPKAYKAYVDNIPVELTPKEIDVLSFLISNSDRAVSREEILDSVWGYEYYGDTRNVDSLIKRLRQKIAKYNSKISIVSVYGVGYKIESGIGS